MKNKVENISKVICFLLSVLLVWDSTGIYTLTANASETNSVQGIEDTVFEGSFDGSDDGTDRISDGDISSGGAGEGDSIHYDSMSVMAEDNSEKDMLASGTYYGMTWTINQDGELAISGIYNADAEVGVSWQDYASDVINVKVSAMEVRSIADWFRNFNKLKTVDFTKFDSGNVRNANSLFYMCTSLESISWGNFNTTNITDMGYMFFGCRNLKILDVSNFNTSKVKDMRYMFGGCSALTELDVDGFITAKVTNMTGMFYNCSNVSKLNVSNFNTIRVTDMSFMFADCYSLTSLDVSDFNTAVVTNMSSMFQNCALLTTLDVSSFDTSKVEHMSAMFYGCSSVVKLDVSSFDTAYVTNMTHMFSDCRELTEIAFGDFSTVRATDMDYMFYKCYKLVNLDMSSFYLVRLKSAENMLAHCGAIEQLQTPRALNVEIALPFEMQDESGNRYQILPRQKYENIYLQRIPYSAESIPDQVYTGEAIKPEVVVMKDGEILTEGVDYKLYYKNNKNVGSVDDQNAPQVIVKGMGRYSGSFVNKFNIVAKVMTEENITVDEMIVDANNKTQTPRPVVKVDGRKLTFNKDFVVEYPDRSEGAYKEPGRYEVVIKGKCNYNGIYTAYVDILSENQIKASELTVDKIPAYTYDEEMSATPLPTVKYKKNTLILNQDYSISYENNDKPGKATMIITGLKNTAGTYVCGTLKKTFTIKGTPLKRAVVTYDSTAVYTGNGIYPQVTLTYGEKTLRQAVDYTIQYTDNVNVGKGKIILTGCGAYTGVVQKTFFIKPEDGIGDMLDVYVGNDGEAEYTTGGSKPEVWVMLDRKLLQEGVDYTVSYLNNKRVAKANAKYAPTVVIKGKGNYKFSRRETFTITSKSLADKDITVTVADKYIGSSDLRSQPVLTDENGKVLKRGEDYSIVGYKIGGVDYDKKNIPEDATRAIVTVKGMGGYTGELSIMYRITQKSISQTKITAKNLEYNGSEVEYTPELIKLGKFVVTDEKTNEELEYGVDYEIIGYQNNTRKGLGKVIIKGLGDYGGERKVKFRIVSTKIPL